MPEQGREDRLQRPLNVPPPHWYFVYQDYCPVCASARTFRERRYGERPARWEDRHLVDDTAYDYCDAL